MKSPFGVITLTWFLREVSAKFPSGMTEKHAWYSHCHIDLLMLISWALPMQANHTNQHLTGTMQEEKLMLGYVALMHFCTAQKSWLPGAGHGASDRQLFLWVFKFFNSPAHTESPVSSCRGQFRCSSGCVHFCFSMVWYCFMPAHTQVSTHRASHCSSSATSIPMTESCTCLCPRGVGGKSVLQLTEMEGQS